MGDYEVVRCFENANYFKDKYSGVEESQIQGNISQQQQDENQSQIQGNVSQQQQDTASSNNSSDTWDSSYPDICITTFSAKLSCFDIPYKSFTVLAPDPHRLDSDGDGIGCEG